mmetsp:Transcript_16449/g.33082  ORF Transcript_16449/g.33082 Transcript_16449/m.33082 type:complete len:85 (+) Transcript_16449:89-343(+)
MLMAVQGVLHWSPVDVVLNLWQYHMGFRMTVLGLLGAALFAALCASLYKCYMCCCAPKPVPRTDQAVLRFRSKMSEDGRAFELH